MNTHHQKGFTTTLYIVLILIAVIGAGGFMIYKERQGLLKTIEEKNNVISEQKVSIETLEQANSKLATENETLTRQIELLNKIADQNDEERKKREKKIRELESAYKTLTAGLPPTLSDAQVATATDLEIKNSALRINYIWNIFQMDHSKLNQQPLNIHTSQLK